MYGRPIERQTPEVTRSWRDTHTRVIFTLKCVAGLSSLPLLRVGPLESLVVNELRGSKGRRRPELIFTPGAYMSRVNPTPTFWRCGECGTPNPNAGYVTNCLGCGVPKPAQTRPATAKSDGFFNKATREKSSETVVIPRWRLWLGRLLLGAAWLYAIVMVGLLVGMAILGERWWPMTFVLFGPRWVTLFPLALLVPLALVARRRGNGLAAPGRPVAGDRPVDGPLPALARSDPNA